MLILLVLIAIVWSNFFASSVLLYLYCAPLYTQQYKQFFTKQFSCQLGEPSNIFDNLEKYILKFWQIHFICQLRSPQWVRVRTLNSCVISRLCQVSSRNSILTNTFRQFEQIYLTVWKNIFENFTTCISNFDKYIWQFEQIYLIIWTNIFDNLNKYIWQFEQIYMTIWTNIFDSLDKYISNFGKYSESEILNSSIISSLCQVRFPKEIQHLFKLCAHKTATQSLDLSNLSLNKKIVSIFTFSPTTDPTHTAWKAQLYLGWPGPCIALQDFLSSLRKGFLDGQIQWHLM